VRQFAQKGFRIENLAVEAKIIYTGFLLFSLAALAVSVVYYYDLVGDAPLAGAREYYAGDREPVAGPAAAEDAAAGGGPDIEIPEEQEDGAAPDRLVVPMTRRKLLEVTHFHLFTVPVFLLIIAHLFMLCGVGPRLKLAVILSGVASSGAHMAAPWLVFSGGGGWAWTMPVTGTWMTVSMLVMCGWPMWSMWASRNAVHLN